MLSLSDLVLPFFCKENKKSKFLQFSRFLKHIRKVFLIWIAEI